MSKNTESNPYSTDAMLNAVRRDIESLQVELQGNLTEIDDNPKLLALLSKRQYEVGAAEARAELLFALVMNCASTFGPSYASLCPKGQPPLDNRGQHASSVRAINQFFNLVTSN